MGIKEIALRVNPTRRIGLGYRTLRQQPSLARASDDQPQMFLADIDPQRARRKRIVRVPDQHVIDRLADRRPEMYGELIQPHQLERPGR